MTDNDKEIGLVIHVLSSIIPQLVEIHLLISSPNVEFSFLFLPGHFLSSLLSLMCQSVSVQSSANVQSSVLVVSTVTFPSAVQHLNIFSLIMSDSGLFTTGKKEDEQ